MISQETTKKEKMLYMHTLYAISKLISLFFRRFQNQEHLPKRFTSLSVAKQNALFNPRDVAPPDPTFRTTYAEYGKYPPNKHTQPYSYHGLNTRFSQKKFNQGMYKNHSFNL